MDKDNVIVYVNGTEVTWDEIPNITIDNPVLSRILANAEKRITRES